MRYGCEVLREGIEKDKWWTIKEPFGNVVLITSFVFFENTCGWKNM